MSIRAKVIGCFLAILVLFSGASLFNYYSSRQANERLALVNGLFLPLSGEVVQIQGTVHNLVEEMRRFYFRDGALSGEGSTFSRMVRDLYPYLIRKKFETAERLLEKEGGSRLKDRVGEISRLLVRARELFDQMTATTERDRFDRLYGQLRTQLAAISRRVDEECQEITLTSQREGRQNLISSLILSSIVGLFGILTLLLSHRALSPLPVLIQAIKKISDGDFHQSLKVKGTDEGELAHLAREYNRMLEALRERDAKIQKQQQELLQSERLAAVGQLSAEVVHEIRNPLNSISLNIDWLEHEISRTGSESPEVGRTIQSVAREIQRLNQIAESYLVRARVPVAQSGQAQKTEVHELLEEILDFSREEDRARNISVETRWAGREIFVRSDRSRLKQAFLNVLKNAKEAMPRGGVLRVQTEVSDNVYRIRFVDSGHGMGEKARQRTFQPFFTTKPGGTGLGLMLTKSIVEEAHGTVECESHLGRGTTFTFQFPV